MKILNLMLGSGRGGLEQAAVDYAEALAIARIPSITVTAPNAWVNEALVHANIAPLSLNTHGQWDMLAAWRLKKILASQQIQTIIANGNRALSMALLARRLGARVPVIAIAQNYKTRRFIRADHAFTITNDLKRHLIAQGMDANCITVMPNAARLSSTSQRPAWRTPPVIGSMGRFVAKKGFEVYIEALGILKAQGHRFSALLGGDGALESELKALATRHGLDGTLSFIGWVSDRNAFWNRIDLFALPSHHEPFGIVLAEAMGQALPVVSTASEGPSEVLTSGSNGTLTKLADAPAMAAALAAYLSAPDIAVAHGNAARATVAEHYTLQAMAKRLQTALAAYI